MNIVSDAFRFFTNLNKEASAKHILIKGVGAKEKLLQLKAEIESSPDVSTSFSEIAAKVSFLEEVADDYDTNGLYRSVSAHLRKEEATWGHSNLV